MTFYTRLPKEGGVFYKRLKMATITLIFKAPVIHPLAIGHLV